MNPETINNINTNYQARIFNYNKSLQLNINTSVGDTSVYKDNWEICRLNQITDLIEELTKLREAIAEETGITF